MMTLTRNRSIAPTIPYAFLHGVDGGAVTNIPLPLEWDHAHFINSAIGFTANTTRIFIKRGSSGIYEIDASAGIVKAGGNPSECVIELYINGVACECSAAHGSVGAAAEHADAFLHVAVYLDVADYVEIYASVDAGTGTVEGDTSRFHIKAISLDGWNNKRAGSSKYPFRQE